MEASAPANTGGLTETLFFQVTARGIQNQDAYPLTYDIRIRNSRVRGKPFLSRPWATSSAPARWSAIVWTQTGGGERHPKVEAVFVGLHRARPRA